MAWCCSLVATEEDADKRKESELDKAFIVEFPTATCAQRPRKEDSATPTLIAFRRRHRRAA